MALAYAGISHKYQALHPQTCSTLNAETPLLCSANPNRASACTLQPSTLTSAPALPLHLLWRHSPHATYTLPGTCWQPTDACATTCLQVLAAYGGMWRTPMSSQPGCLTQQWLVHEISLQAPLFHEHHLSHRM
jgi:hypothetical protein